MNTINAKKLSVCILRLVLTLSFLIFVQVAANAQYASYHSNPYKWDTKDNTGNPWKWGGGTERTIYNPLDGGILLKYTMKSQGNSDGCSAGLPDEKKLFQQACFAHDTNYDAPFPLAGKEISDYLFYKDMQLINNNGRANSSGYNNFITDAAADLFYAGVVLGGTFRGTADPNILAKGGVVAVSNNGAYIMKLNVKWTAPDGTTKNVEVVKPVGDKAVVPLSIGAKNIEIQASAIGGVQIFSEKFNDPGMYAYTVGGITLFPTFKPPIILQTGTPLSEGDFYTFLLGKNDDLFAIQRNGTGSGKTEVHVLSKASNYQKFTGHFPTALQQTTANDFDFLLAQNGDLFAIQKNGTGSGKTEVHILSAASKYQAFTDHIPTALEEAGTNFSFLLGPNRDLFAIKRRSTGSGKTEVHVLLASSGYKIFSFQKAIPLPETDASYEFALAANWDLYFIKKSNTGTRSTEVHGLSRVGDYQKYFLHTGTVLPETDSSFWFGVTSEKNLFAIKKSNTGSKSSEVHIIGLP